METMYDRLGDLLNETLEAGHVKFVKPRSIEEEPEKKAEPPKEEETSRKTRAEPVKEKRTGFFNRERKATGTIIKAIPPEVERACRLLGVTVNTTKEEIKKAYKEKLQYYHPDKHAGNAILEKVATDKTRQVVEAYELLIKYLEK